MKNLAKWSIIVIYIMQASCRNNTGLSDITNAREFASKYCDCMKQNKAPKDFLNALKVCDSEFTQKNRLFRLYKTHLRYLETAQKISYKTKDSVFKFMRVVDSCTRDNCCESTANCPGATK